MDNFFRRCALTLLSLLIVTVPHSYAAVVPESYMLPVADKALLLALPADVRAHPTIKYLLDGRDYSDFLAAVQAPGPDAWAKEETLATLQPKILFEGKFLLSWACLYGRQHEIALGMGADSLTIEQEKKVKRYVIAIVSAALRMRAVRIACSTCGKVYLEVDARVNGERIYWNFYFTGTASPLLRASVSPHYSSIKERCSDGTYRRPDPKADSFASPKPDRMRVRSTVTCSQDGSPGVVRHLALPAEITSPGMVPPAAASPSFTIAFDLTKPWRTDDFVEHMADAEHQARLKKAGYSHEDLPGVAVQIEAIVKACPWLLMPHWYTLGGAAKNKSIRMRTEQAFWIPLYARKTNGAGALVPYGLPVLYLALTPKYDYSSGTLIEYKLSTALLPHMIEYRVLAAPASVRINQEALMKYVPFEEAAGAAAAGHIAPFEAVLIARAAKKKERIAAEHQAELERLAEYNAMVSAEKEALRELRKKAAEERKRIAQAQKVAAQKNKEARKSAERAKAKEKRLKKAKESILEAARNAYMHALQSGEGVPRDALEGAIGLGFANHRVDGEEYALFKEEIRKKAAAFMRKQQRKVAEAATPAAMPTPGVKTGEGAPSTSKAKSLRKKKKRSKNKKAAAKDAEENDLLAAAMARADGEAQKLEAERARLAAAAEEADAAEDENRFLSFSPGGPEGRAQAYALAAFKRFLASKGDSEPRGGARAPLRDISPDDISKMNTRFLAAMAACDEDESGK